MSPRAIRRAAERKAAKFAAKAGSTAAVAAQPPQSVPAAEPATTTQAAKVMTASVGGSDETSDFIAAALDAIPPTANEPWAVSNARLAANRANAQKSTGPASTEGKATSSKNALKTGLTGATVLLPNDDAIIYQAFVESIFEQYTPATDQENRLTQLIADTEWRIHRIAPLEAGIFAVARIEQPDWFFSETDKQKREFLWNAKIQLLYEKPLRNLALQERRLRSQHKNDIATLEQLQQDRIEKQKQAEQAIIDERKAVLNRAVKISNNCIKYKRDFVPADYGFEFSADEYDHYWERNDAQYKITEKSLDFDTVIAAYRNAKKERQAA